MLIENPTVFLVTSLFTLILFLSVIKKINTKVLIGIFIVFVGMQFFRGSLYRLSYLSNEDKILKPTRLNEYPLSYSIFNNKYYFPFAHWLEERPESIIFYNILENTSKVIDVNYYFFASHPRETTESGSSEKFTYLLLPFLIIGLYILIEHNNKLYFSLFSISLLISTLSDHTSGLGYFLIYPFLSVGTLAGVVFVKEKVGSIKKIKRYIPWTIWLLVLFQIVLLWQQFAYEFI